MEKDKIQALPQEDLNQPQICIICMESPSDAVYYDCGHGGKSKSFKFRYLLWKNCYSLKIILILYSLFNHNYPGICFNCSIEVLRKGGACHLCRKVFQIIEQKFCLFLIIKLVIDILFFYKFFLSP